MVSMSSSSVTTALLVLLSLVVPPSSAQCPQSCECSAWLETYIACRGTLMSEAPDNTYTPSLETLYFTYNKNMDEVRGGALAVARYTTLRVLVLNNNAISRVDPDAFKGLKSVKQLDLSSNLITTLPQQVFAPLKRLSRLNLSGNRQVVLPNQGWNLTRLSVLSLKNCALDTIPLHFFDNMPNLKAIKLDRNKFSSIDGNVFRPVIKTLQLLDLSINKFKQLPRRVLEVVPDSVELHLENNPFNCDCKFRDSYCLYERRNKKLRLQCRTPKEMRRVDGSQVTRLLNCDDTPTCKAK